MDEPSVHHTPGAKPSAAGEWKKFLLLAFVALPVAAVLLICAYGFLVWFGQILWWGPPK